MRNPGFLSVNSLRYGLLMLVGLLVCRLLPAQEQTPAPASPEPLQLAPMLVTATASTAGGIDLPLESAHVVTVIPVSDLLSGKQSLSEVLEKTAGVEVKEWGGAGSYATMSIRGSSAQQVSIYLEGVLLNPAQGGGVDLSTIPLQQVESIEIYRGSAPAEFAMAGMGGVVNIRTRTAAKKPSASLRLGTGSFGQREASAFLAMPVRSAKVAVAATILSSDGDFSYENDNGTVFNKNDDHTDKRRNNALRQQDCLLKAAIPIGERMRLELQNTFFHKDKGLPGQGNNPAEEVGLDAMRNMTRARLIWADALGKGSTVSATAWHQYEKTEYDDPQGEIGIGRQKNVYRTTQNGAQIEVRAPLAQWVDASFQLTSTIESYDPDYGMGNAQGLADSTRESWLASTGLTFRWWDDRVLLTPMLRGQWHESDFSDDRTGSLGIDRSSRETALDAQCSALVRITDGWYWKGSIGSYTRVPNLYELFGDRGLQIGNPSLQPEEGVNVDAGLRFERFRLMPGLDHVLVEVVGFRRSAENLIRTVYDARGIGRATNLAEATIHGAELTFALDIGKHLRLRHALTLQDAEGESAYAYEDGKSIPGLPERSYFARAEWYWTMWDRWAFTLFSEVRGDSGGFYDAANLLPRKSDLVTNAGFEWRGPHLDGTLEIRNITDREREEIIGYPMPGRSVHLSATLTF